MHARCWVLRDRIFSASVEEGRTSGPLLLDINGQGERYRPYFENYTVDASILDSWPFGVVDHKDQTPSSEGGRSLVNLHQVTGVDRFKLM